MTVAAIQMAEKNVRTQRSYCMATRRQSLIQPRMLSIVWRCL